MTVSLITVTFRNLAKSPGVTSRARDLARRLWRYDERIQRCHLTIEGRSPVHSNACLVKVDLDLPGARIHAESGENTPHSTQHDVNVALREAIGDARRQLLDLTQRRGRERISSALAAHVGVSS